MLCMDLPRSAVINLAKACDSGWPRDMERCHTAVVQTDGLEAQVGHFQRCGSKQHAEEIPDCLLMELLSSDCFKRSRVHVQRPRRRDSRGKGIRFW